MSQLDVEDAVQEVFYDCFRENGALCRVEMGAPSRFRRFLFGVTRTTALALESRRRRDSGRGTSDGSELDELPAAERSLADAFDRAWAQSIVAEALRLQVEDARARGRAAVRRVELLRLRIFDGIPIRTIASRWKADRAHLHHEYARARAEYHAALRETLAAHATGKVAIKDEDLAELLRLLE